MKELIPEIEGLGNWLSEYAGKPGATEEERIKLSDASHYLQILKMLVSICPEETLKKVQL